MIMLKELLELQEIVLNIKMIHSMLMVKQSEPYLNYNEKRKQAEYITGSFKTKIYQMLILNLMLFLKVNI